jgi:putative ABC transport system permease protein
MTRASAAVLDYAFWQNHLGADPGVVGQKILINGQPMTIVGVAPRGFDGTSIGVVPNVYVPISMRGVIDPGFTWFNQRATYWIYLFGRLKAGVSIEQASRQLNAIFRPIINDVEAPLLVGVSNQTMARFRARSLVLSDGRRGQSTLRDARRGSLVLLFGITGVVLLIACANIANLLLARGATRASEMAVRLSLGGSRRQLVMQLLAESLVLALVGGAASVAVAHGTLGLLMRLLPGDQSAGLAFQLDGTAFAFTAALSLGTGLLFGLFPALNATRPDLVTTLRAGMGKHSGTRGAARFRTGLVTAQIALSMALLSSAGLFVQSLRNLGHVDLGFDITNLVTFELSPSLNGYAHASSQALFRRVESELAALPGVTTATASLVPALGGWNWDNSVSVEGFRKGPDTDDDAYFNEVGPGYFRAMGIPLLAGREFTASDVAGSPQVAIVNEEFARKFGLGHNVVGKYMGQHKGDTLDIQIVGLVKNTKYSGVRNQRRPIYMLPYRQDTLVGDLTFYARTGSNPATLLRAIPSLVSRIDPQLPVEALKSMPQQLNENIYLDRLVSTLSAAFAALATLLAAIGLYGVLSYSVAQRTREIGVRMALGADTSRVRGMVMRQVGGMTVIGGLTGIVAALAIGRAASSLLFELHGFDPAVTIFAAALLATVAFCAGYLPARKASRVDPIQALRYE